MHMWYTLLVESNTYILSTVKKWNMIHQQFFSVSPLVEFRLNWTALFVFWNEFNIINFNSVVIFELLFHRRRHCCSLCYRIFCKIANHRHISNTICVQREKENHFSKRRINVYFIFLSVWHIMWLYFEYWPYAFIFDTFLFQHLYSSEKKSIGYFFYYTNNIIINSLFTKVWVCACIRYWYILFQSM